MRSSEFRIATFSCKIFSYFADPPTPCCLCLGLTDEPGFRRSAWMDETIGRHDFGSYDLREKKIAAACTSGATMEKQQSWPPLSLRWGPGCFLSHLFPHLPLQVRHDCRPGWFCPQALTSLPKRIALARARTIGKRTIGNSARGFFF